MFIFENKLSEFKRVNLNSKSILLSLSFPSSWSHFSSGHAQRAELLKGCNELQPCQIDLREVSTHKTVIKSII